MRTRDFCLGSLHLSGRGFVCGSFAACGRRGEGRLIYQPYSLTITHHACCLFEIKVETVGKGGACVGMKKQRRRFREGEVAPKLSSPGGEKLTAAFP